MSRHVVIRKTAKYWEKGATNLSRDLGIPTPTLYKALQGGNAGNNLIAETLYFTGLPFEKLFEIVGGSVEERKAEPGVEELAQALVKALKGGGDLAGVLQGFSLVEPNVEEFDGPVIWEDLPDVEPVVLRIWLWQEYQEETHPTSFEGSGKIAPGRDYAIHREDYPDGPYRSITPLVEPMTGACASAIKALTGYKGDLLGSTGLRGVQVVESWTEKDFENHLTP